MHSQQRTQRGVSIIEALVSFLILSMGLLAFARIQTELRFAADVSRQRAEAVRLAQENMESLRAFTLLAAPSAPTSGVLSYDGNVVANTPNQTVGLSNINTEFGITRTITSSTTSTIYRTLRVSVGWKDRRDGDQEVVLNSIIARVDPREAGKVTISPPPRTNAKNPKDRDVRIPIDAVDLGNNQSGFKPPGQSQMFWVFDSDSANILKKCTFTGSNTDVNASTYASATCTERAGYLLKGFIRFDVRNNPSSVTPGSTACDFYERIVPNSAQQVQGKNTCAAIATPTDLLSVTMPDSSTGYSPSGSDLPKFECYDDFTINVKSDRDYATYYCAIYVATAGSGWSGKSVLANTTAWSFGITSADTVLRNCRYTADYSRNGQLAEDWEHPYSYDDVRESLTAQNFLLVPGSAACPTGSDNIGNTGLTVNYRTCQHQPAPANTSQTPTEAANACAV